MKKLVAAVVQSAPPAFDTDKTLEKLADLASDAAGKKAQLAVFPEAFVGSYPKGLDFGMRLGMRTDEGREDFKRYFAAAIELPGPELDKIGEIAKKTGLHMVVGAIEREGGTLYCTAVMFNARGDYLGKHRKLMPTALERAVWGQGDGSTLNVYDTELGRLGAVICWENRMPLLRMTMFAKGIELYCVPTVDDRENWIPLMQTVAFEGRCFVLSACQFAKRSDFPDDYNCIQGNDPDGVLINGGSVMVSPFGEILAGPEYGSETILTAELDLGDIARGKYDFDVTGHYARPDIFELKVNEAPMAVVSKAEETD